MSLNTGPITARRLALLNNGHRPVPQNGKAPVMAGWQNHHTAEEIARWEYDRPNERNTGIVAGGVSIGADLDIRDEVLCDRLQAKLFDYVGKSEFCRVGQAPKRLFMYRVEEIFGKFKTGELFPNADCRPEEKCQVEILANGQQFVVDGIHPDTRRPYTWNGPTPFEVAVADMPLARRSDIQAFVAEAERVLRAHGYKTKAEWHPKPEAPRAAEFRHDTNDRPPIEVVEDAARYLARRNDYDRDTWIKIGMAMKSCGDSFRSIWEDFCLSYPDNSAREAQYRWTGLKPNGSASPGTLIYMAKQKGWECPEHLRSSNSTDYSKKASDAPVEEIIDPVDLWSKFEAPILPRGLLPDLIERFAFDQGDDIGADPAGVAMAALAVCAGATPDKVKIQVKKHNRGWHESARIWVALVGSPSTKKSPIIRSASWPLLHLDKELAREYANQRAIYDALTKEEKKQTPPPKHTRLVLQDTTIEAAGEILRDSPNGVLCHQDEMSGWFGSMDKYSGARGSAKDRAFWLQAYDGGPHSVERISRGSLYIPNLSASKLGGIQPEPIRKIAGETVDDGLLQRDITIILRPAIAGKDAPASDVVSEYRQLIGRLTKLKDLTLHFDDGAQEYRQELEHRHLELQQIEAISPKLSSHIGKYDGLFARLCVLWHCIEHAEPPPIVSEELARRVGKFMSDFLLPHAMAFYAGTLGLSDQHERLAAVAGYVLAHKLDRLTNREIQRGDRTMRNLDKAGIEEVFNALDTLGWITLVPASRPGAMPHGVVNPAVHTKFSAKAKSEAERRTRERKMIAEMARKRD